MSATIRLSRRLWSVKAELSAVGLGPVADAEQAVTALYQAHAAGLTRLAVVMTGDLSAAEDIVQDAFCGLYRRFGTLTQPEKALQYVRSSVINGCRSELRARKRNARLAVGGHPATVDSAEYDVLVGEEHQEVLTALRRLPDRQREVLVLRYFLDLPDSQIARSMGISQVGVRSTVSRALAALARLLGETR
jgi:RNA polymerase sigma-70 factor (sigma-E family)